MIPGSHLIPGSHRRGSPVAERQCRSVELAQARLAPLQPPAILLGPGFEHFAAVSAERELRVQRPVRIEQRLAADRDEIGLALRQDIFGLLRMQDQADRDGRDAGLLADFSA